MPSLPNSDSDVYFGDTETPLPNWRDELPDDDSDSDKLTSEEEQAVIGMLGFDPSESEHDEEGNVPKAPSVPQSPFVGNRAKKAFRVRVKGASAGEESSFQDHDKETKSVKGSKVSRHKPSKEYHEDWAKADKWYQRGVEAGQSGEPHEYNGPDEYRDVWDYGVMEGMENQQKAMKEGSKVGERRIYKARDENWSKQRKIYRRGYEAGHQGKPRDYEGEDSEYWNYGYNHGVGDAEAGESTLSV